MKRVIVTGSRGLIGAEITRYLIDNDYIVLELDIQLGHDLTDEKFVIDYFANNEADYLINCFALNDHVIEHGARSTMFNISLDTIQEYLNINTVALFSVCRQFAINKTNKSRGIINFASTYSIVSANPALYNGGEKNIGYVISKAAVPQLTRHLAVHLAPNIRVNCIIPHGVKNNQGKEFESNFNKMSPLGRMMDKSELNGLIKYLCSDDSSYMTGSVLMIDGGWTIW